jgi:hypothetical protein
MISNTLFEAHSAIQAYQDQGDYEGYELELELVKQTMEYVRKLEGLDTPPLRPDQEEQIFYWTRKQEQLMELQELVMCLLTRTSMRLIGVSNPPRECCGTRCDELCTCEDNNDDTTQEEVVL